MPDATVILDLVPAGDVGLDYPKDGAIISLDLTPTGEVLFRYPAFLPSSIPGLQLWLDADRGLFTDSGATAPVASDGDVVGTWQDQSGNNNDFIQTTAAKKPLYKTSQINGKDIVRFDGADDLLIASNFNSALEGSIFIVYELNLGLEDAKTIFSSSDEATGTKFFVLRAISSIANDFLGLSQRNTDTADKIEGNTSQIIDTPYLASWHSNGSIYTLRLNGALETISIIGGANNGDWLGDTDARDNFVVGGLKISSGETQFFRGDIRQILLYDTNIVGDDLTNIERFLATDAGITLL